ncbi:FtsX-like permease family protein [Treponema bryantii]|uniref:FtsX-like permease family protein n=1 Tax=Treponema bryantii TaxID=163 RepID=UPI002B2A766A|nr:hypothetical protein TRBR_25940 [Treponema bryantii]
MLFEISTSVRNIRVRRKDMLKKVWFIFPSIIIFLLSIGLIIGAGNQMLECLNNYQGDIYINSKYTEGDISEVVIDSNNNLSSRSEIYKECTLPVILSSLESYSNALCKGIEKSYFPKFEKTIGWVEKPAEILSRGSCLIDVKTASILKTKVGDYITIQYTADDGFMNTLRVVISGIYIGNPYLYDNVIFIPYEDSCEIVLNEIATDIKIYFESTISDVELHDIAHDFEKKYVKTTNISTRTDFENDNSYLMFSYYRIFLIVVMIFIIMIIAVILFLSIKHMYFMEFRKRRSELSTYLAFGMQPKEILLIVFFETCFFYILSIVLAIIFFNVFKYLLSFVHIKSIAHLDFVSLLGGNTIIINCPVHLMICVICITFFFVLLSSLQGANKYLKMHIKDIISSE